MDFACLVTVFGVCKCWKAPACFGLAGVLCASLCWEQRALGDRLMAKSAGGASFFWSLVGVGVGIYYVATGSNNL